MNSRKNFNAWRRDGDDARRGRRAPWRPDRPEPEGRDHTEVAAPTADRPEQVRLGIGAGPDDFTRGQHDLSRDKIVDSQPCLPMVQPKPPPRVRPATPVVEITPPVVASPCSYRRPR